MTKTSLSHRNNLKGIIFMILHALSASMLFALVKTLSKDISSNQVVFLYKFTLLLIISPWIIKNGLKVFYTERLKTYIVSGIFGTSATLCLMYGIQHIPLANVTALWYMEKIFLVIIGVIFFKEKIDIKRATAIILSFIGAIIVILPRLNLSNFNNYYYFIFAAVILWLLYCLTIKSLGKTEKLTTQTLYNILVSTILSSPIAFIGYSNGNFSWTTQTIELIHLPFLLLTSLCYLIVCTSNFKSFQCGDLSVVGPFGYTKIIFAGILGMIFFNEYPLINSYIGYIIIGLCSWYLVKTAIKTKTI
ncbi:MAG: DMT family transporter [Rickettsiales bacterium]|nr:DMT family transporter [Rickettsiales bacterium]